MSKADRRKMKKSPTQLYRTHTHRVIVFARKVSQYKGKIKRRPSLRSLHCAQRLARRSLLSSRELVSERTPLNKRSVSDQLPHLGSSRAGSLRISSLKSERLNWVASSVPLLNYLGFLSDRGQHQTRAVRSSAYLPIRLDLQERRARVEAYTV